MSEGRATSRIDHRSIALLGIVTICAYGAWYYAFGVLLDPIRLDTGWAESTLASSFSAGTVLIGLFALFGGRVLDRAGHRPVFVAAALVGGGSLIIASLATHVAVFFVGAALGSAAFGSLGFYHVTMTTAVRLNPNEPTRAIAALTIWGAFASAIFLPGASWLEEELGWRWTARILAGITGAVFLLAAARLPPSVPANRPAPATIRSVLVSTVSSREPRLFTTAVACAGLAMSTMLVYQVPMMTAAGLGSATAASMAGLRGFCQLGGRLPLTPIVARFGRDRALLLALTAMTLGGALLVAAGSLPVAIAFAVIAGFGIGAFSPLHGMKSEQLFARHQLGATMGVYGGVLLLAGSIGPVLAGFIAEQTGERRWASAIIVMAGLGSITAVALVSRLERSADRAVEPTSTSKA